MTLTSCGNFFLKNLKLEKNLKLKKIKSYLIFDFFENLLKLFIFCKILNLKNIEIFAESKKKFLEIVRNFI